MTVEAYIFKHDVDIFAMATIRKTILLPEQIAKRLDREAKCQKTPVSAILTKLVQQQSVNLPYASLIDDDEQPSQSDEQLLARLAI